MVLIGNDLLFPAFNKETFSHPNARRIILNSSENVLFEKLNVCHSLSLAWTIKESIYKIVCKNGFTSAFSPCTITITNLEISDPEYFSGKAIFQNENYFFRSEINKEYIYTYASNHPDILSKIEHHYFKHDISIRSSLSNPDFISFLNQNKWQLTHTDNGIPEISNPDSQIDISLTHDHNLMILCEYKNQ
jgi:phosphopantetheinyl transferase (holo-ACP synthase)